MLAEALALEGLEQLVVLLQDWRSSPDPAEDPWPIQRIVLYIDDLDLRSPD